MTKNGDWKWAAKTLLVGLVAGCASWLAWLSIQVVGMKADIAEIKANVQIRHAAATLDPGNG